MTLSIDGLSVFAFSENKNYTHYIIPAGQQGRHPGLAPHEPGLRFVPGRRLTPRAKWPRPLPSSTQRRHDHGRLRRRLGRRHVAAAGRGPSPKGAPPADATGRGPSVAAKFVEVVKDVGVARSSVSIRYTKPDPSDLPQ